ncbi:MAG: tetratricopeptide repeat protein, partial [Myxococcota bacterium]
MSKKKQSNTTGDALREMEASGDRVADWASRNGTTILAVAVGVLILAAGAGFYVQHAATARDDAANALALTSGRYRLAMGADLTAGSIVEPANFELAAETRSQFAQEFAELAQAHAGTAAGALAWLESGNLQAELGQIQEAAESFEAARTAAKGLALEAIAATRLAGLAEDRGDSTAAAEAYELAADVKAYPLRGTALAEAAK